MKEFDLIYAAISDNYSLYISLGIIAVCIFFGIFIYFSRKDGGTETVADEESSTEKFERKAPAARTSAPVVPNGVSEEVVAVIAAAVASMAPEGKRYAVRSIARAGKHHERSVWAAAGLAESTRPF